MFEYLRRIPLHLRLILGMWSFILPWTFTKNLWWSLLPVAIIALFALAYLYARLLENAPGDPLPRVPLPGAPRRARPGRRGPAPLEMQDMQFVVHVPHDPRGRDIGKAIESPKAFLRYLKNLKRGVQWRNELRRNVPSYAEWAIPVANLQVNTPNLEGKQLDVAIAVQDASGAVVYSTTVSHVLTQGLNQVYNAANALAIAGTPGRQHRDTLRATVSIGGAIRQSADMRIIDSYADELEGVRILGADGELTREALRAADDMDAPDLSDLLD